MLDPRYLSVEMRELWSEDKKFELWGEVLTRVAKASRDLKVFAVENDKAFFASPIYPNEAQVRRAEAFTKHELGAFLKCFAGEETTSDEERRWMHYGLTSSDLIDTAQSLRIKQSSILILKAMAEAKEQLALKISETLDLEAAGRTHGQVAEAIQFSSRFERALDTLEKAEIRFKEAAFGASLCMLSGPTGGYAVLPRDVELQVGKWFGLPAAHSRCKSSQVLPRILITDLMYANASIASAIETLTTQLRLLSLSEVGEVSEGYEDFQVGSSSMPHKRNPIANENLCGMARQVKGYVPVAFDNVALWHERDMSHSCVERTILPDSLGATEYMLQRFGLMLSRLVIDKEAIRHNLTMGFPFTFSFGLLSFLVRSGWRRQQAHEALDAFLAGKKWGSPIRFYRESSFVIGFAAHFSLSEEQTEEVWAILGGKKG